MSFVLRSIAATAALAAAFLVSAAIPGAEAQGTGYGFPYGGSRPPQGRSFGASAPGDFDYYALVLSWSPSFCAGHETSGNDPQCHPRNGRRYAFVLHGLWPQYERHWPQDCYRGSPPFVPQPVVDRMLDIMPSPKLVIHEYVKHGTCSGLSPEQFFDLARKEFEGVKIPSRFVDAAGPQFVSPGELAREIHDANPRIPMQAIAVSCDRGSGNKLVEVHICLSRSGIPRPCGQNESLRRMCSASRMYVPPVRLGGGQGNVPPAPTAPGAAPVLPPQSPPPGPIAPPKGQRTL